MYSADLVLLSLFNSIGVMNYNTEALPGVIGGGNISSGCLLKMMVIYLTEAGGGERGGETAKRARRAGVS